MYTHNLLTFQQTPDIADVILLYHHILQSPSTKTQHLQTVQPHSCRTQTL